MDEWVRYLNGNYVVYFNTIDGTKIKRSKDDKLIAAFPDTIDVTISKKCIKECDWCYLGCRKDMPHGEIINRLFWNTIHPYTELAINLNMPIHPDLHVFLMSMKDRKVFVNVTVNQEHFMIDSVNNMLWSLYNKGLIKGIGVSLTGVNKDFIKSVKKFPTAVIHVINGLFTSKDLDALKGNNLKLLILGYKTQGRGRDWQELNNSIVAANMQWLKSNLKSVINSFSVTSFDNLALDQLCVKDILGDDYYNLVYNGSDGSCTMALNLVKGTFSRSSTSEAVGYIDDKSIEYMFSKVKVN